MAGKHFHRYLLYAFGEILLVVVGILIALQIDNWNEERKEHRRETAILQKLHREFQANLVDFNAIYELNQQKLRALDTVIHYMNNTHLPQAYDRIDENFWMAAFGKFYNPKRGTVESLINSGSIDLIQNDTLRDYLTSWPYVLEDYKEEEEFEQFWVYRIPKYAAERGDFSANIGGVFDDLIKETEFRNIFAMRRNSLAQTVSAAESEGVFEHLREIVRLTEVPVE
jgi:hypothetical protein